jgi:hypothetical protein
MTAHMQWDKTVDALHWAAGGSNSAVSKLEALSQAPVINGIALPFGNSLL